MLLEKWLLTGGLGAANDLLYMWGGNAAGNIGVLDVVNRSAPQQIGLLSWNQVSIGASHALAIRSDGLLYAWGSGTQGRLGLGDTFNRSSPSQVGSGSWASVAAGKSHSVGIDINGDLYAWGENSGGQLGLNLGGGGQERSSPTIVGQVNAKDWLYVFSGNDQTFAIDADNVLWAWGTNNTQGGLGTYDLISKSSPVQITSLYSEEEQQSWVVFSGQTPISWSQLSIGRDHVMAIRTDGLLFAWGSNNVGQLGDGTTQRRLTPWQIGNSSWTSVSAGSQHSLGITTAGVLFGWGLNSTSQAYYGDTINRSSPTQLDTNISKASAGDAFSVFIDNDGLIYSFGNNLYGQLGNNSTVNITSIATAKSGAGGAGYGSWSQVYAGRFHVHATRSDGTLWGWGRGTNGQLTYGTPIHRSSPVQVSAIKTKADQVKWITEMGGPTPYSWMQVVSGNQWVLAIRNDYKLFAWGDNANGQLGLNDVSDRISPTQVGESSWVHVAAGISQAAGITSDYTLYTWGSNATYGTLGVNDVVDRSSPTQIANGGSWRWAAMTQVGGFGIKTDGTLWGWGGDNGTRLAQNVGVVSKSSPIQIGSYNDWDKVYATLDSQSGWANSITRGMFAWGLNTTGQLGLGDVSNKAAPIRFTTFTTEGDQNTYVASTLAPTSSWSQISIGGSHAVGITNDGSMYTWGTNPYGQLGNNTINFEYFPTKIATDSSWQFVAAGYDHTAAITTTGNLFTWGYNISGQLGFNDTINRSVPTQVGASTYLQVTAGDDITAAIGSDYNLYTWGNDLDGALGILTTDIDRSAPQQVGGSWTVINATNLVPGFIGIKTDGTLWAWGQNQAGRLGQMDAYASSTARRSKSSPTQISSLNSEEAQDLWVSNMGLTAFSWQQVSVGRSFMMAIRNDGRLFTWGYNNVGQLGFNNLVNSFIPKEIDAVTSWSYVSAGYDNAKAIRSDNKLFVWGLNSSGQLGLNDTFNRSSPVQLGSDDWDIVASNNQGSAGINTLGILYAWGRGNEGQIGTLIATSRSTPQQIGSSSWSFVTGGIDTNWAALDINNRLFTWGINNLGQLGHRNAIYKSSPVQVTSITTEQDQTDWITYSGAVPKSWTQFAIGEDFTLGLQSNGLLWAWGFNDVGQLGDGTTLTRLSMVQIGSSSWAMVAAGTSFALGVTVASTGIDQELYAWGRNNLGQLGQNDVLNRSSPVLVAVPKSVGASFTSITAGSATAHAIVSNYLASSNYGWGWGEATNGALGIVLSAPSTNKSNPTQLGADLAAISAGTQGGIVKRTDGSIWGWGLNTNGQLGIRNTFNFSSPVQISSLNAYDELQSYYTWAGTSAPYSWLQISYGKHHTLAIRSDYKLFAWGSVKDNVNNVDYNNGELGLNDRIGRLYPTQVGTSSWLMVAAGHGAEGHSVGVTSDGKLWAWGSNDLGQLGILTTTNRSSPTQVGTDTNWAYVAAGESRSYAIKSTGALYAWGSDGSGELGVGIQTGALTNRSSPIQIGTSTSPLLYASWTMVHTKGGTAYAIQTDGTLWTWGYNGFGQLMQNNLMNQSSPVQISTIVSETQEGYNIANNPIDPPAWSKISVGLNHTLALTTTGDLYAWGVGNLGQLGLNGRNSETSPRYIDTDYIQISAGQDFSAGIKNDGSLWTWGFNDYGQLGLPDKLNRSAPTQIGSSSWSQISAGYRILFGITTDNTLWFSGYNVNGNAGDNTTINRSTLTQVAADKSWKTIKQNIVYDDTNKYSISTAGLTTDDLLWMWGRHKIQNPYYPLQGYAYPADLTRSSPVQVSSLQTDVDQTSYLTAQPATPVRSWTQIAIGTSSSYGIDTTGKLWTWGIAPHGEQGLNERGLNLWPVPLGASSWTQIAAGDGFALGITTASELYAWGYNLDGRLGLNDRVTRSNPVQIGGTWNKVAAGWSHALAIDSANRLFSWGADNLGQSGQSALINRSSPTQLAGSWSNVWASVEASAAVDINGVGYVWGDNGIYGALGTRNTISKSSPTQLNTLRSEADQQSWITFSGATARSWVQISIADTDHGLAIDTNGSLWAWGRNEEGQLGTGTRDPYQYPVKVGTSSWSLVSAGRSWSVGITTDGTLYTWGSAADGRIGQGDTINRSVPTQIGTSSWTWASADNAAYYGLAIRNDGKLFTWGLNTDGNLGVGDTLNRSSPTLVGQDNDGYSWYRAQTGLGMSAAIRLDYSTPSRGALFVWGTNSTAKTLAQLGNTTTRSSPVQVEALTTEAEQDAWLAISGEAKNSWTTLAMGGGHALALRSDSTLWAWGLNAFGQLGKNDLAPTYSPVRIGNSSWSSISAGNSNSAAIDTLGRLYVWGANENGQLGVGDVIARSTPTQVGTSSWSMVSSQWQYTTAITSDGKLFVWGENNAGQLGVGISVYRSSPVQVSALPNSITKVSAGAYHTLATDSEGVLFAWGNDNRIPTPFPATGQTGSLSIWRKSNPVQITTIFTEAEEDSWRTYAGGVAKSWSQVSKGVSHALAIRSDGRLYAWGLSTDGQLGLSAGGVDVISYQWLPRQVGTSSWSQVSAGNGFSLAITTANKLFSWGVNTNGRLGLGDTISRSSPVQIGTGDWSKIVAGDAHAAAINNLGDLYNWGLGTSGQLGQNNVLSRSSPVQVGVGTAYSEVTVGDAFTHAITTGNQLYAWGLGTTGRLGNNTTANPNRSNPTQITGDWSKVASGLSHTIALKTDNTLWAWGTGTNGQLGISATTNRSSPTQVGTSSWSIIAAGGNFSAAIAPAPGSGLYVWGINTGGQLAQNNVISRSAPQQIGTSSWTNVFAGPTATGAAGILATSNRLYSWGVVPIGDYILQNRSSPVFIKSENDSFSQISAGREHSAVIRADGKLYVFGYNANGQLGLGDVLNRSRPTQVGTSSWTIVDAANNSTYGLLTNSILYAWGINTSGKLGTNAAGDRSSPVAIGTSSWSTVAAGLSADTAVAIKTNNQLFVWGGGASWLLNSALTAGISSPIFLRSNDMTWKSVAVGNSHMLAIRSDDKLFGWGLNANGQLGINTTTPRSNPTQVGSSNWVSITAGGFSSGGQFTANTGAYVWGLNSSGQLGLSVTTARSNPTQIGSNNWRALSIGNTNSAGIDINSQIFAWGAGGANGVIPNGTFNETYNSPLFIRSVDETWDNIQIGLEYGLGLRSDKRLWAWGFNDYGNLGLNDSITRSSPVAVGSSSWAAIAAGIDHTLGLLSDKKLYAWGYSAWGNLGQNGPNVNLSSPTLIGSSSWSIIAAGKSYTVGAVLLNGQLYNWGRNINGQVGNNSLTNNLTNTSSPMFVRGADDKWHDVAPGAGHTLGIRYDRKLFGWGYNDFGQLGDTTVGQILGSPSMIGTSSWTQVFAPSGIYASNNYFKWSLGIDINNLLYVWGATRSSTVGSALLPGNRSIPVQVGTSSWSQLSVGATNGVTLGITSGNRLFAWEGSNPNIGNGSIYTIADANAISSPAFITAQRNTFIDVKSGWWHGLAMKADAYTLPQIYAAGYNTDGQLGDGTTIRRSAPTQVFTAVTYPSFIGTTAWNSYVVDNTYDPTIIYGSGWNDYYQLPGYGTSRRSSPVQIGSGAPNTVTQWSQIDGNQSNFAAIGHGQLFATGERYWGQLGDGSSNPTGGRASSFTMVGVPGNYDSWHAISAGNAHSAAVRADRLIFSWGLNDSGQLGIGNTISRSSTSQVGSGSYNMVSAKSSHTVAVDTDNLLWTWGLNDLGQLGIGNSASRSNPAQVGSESWVTASAGFDRKATGGIKYSNNQLYVWGDSSTGVYANGWINTLVGNSSPTLVITVQDTWSNVGIALNTVGIRADGILYGWGSNSAGQVGDNSTINRSSPTAIGSGSWSNIGLAYEAAFAINTSGLLYAWGLGSAGRLGLDDSINRSVPVQVGAQSWISLAISQYSAMAAIKSSGQLFTWGNNDWGSLGINNMSGSNYSSPQFVRSMTDTYTKAVTDILGSAAIRSDAMLFVWGNNNQGQIGDSSTINKSSPVMIGRSSFIQIGIGVSNFVALRDNYTVWTWGVNSSGQLGLGDTLNRSSPTQLGSAPSGATNSYTFVTAGSSTLAAISTTYQLYTWGAGHFGKIGNGSVNINYSLPVFIPSAIDNFLQVGSSSAHNILLRDDTITFTVGNNNNGQLGDGTTINKSNPVQISGSWASVSAGFSYTMAVSATDLGMYAWGRNAIGQLGLGDTINRSTPQQVGASSWVSVAAGWSNSAAIDIDNQLFSWGANGQGNIGDNLASPNSSSPVFVRTIHENSWTMVSSANLHTMAIRGDGALYTWGDNTNGKLGDNSTLAKSSPVQIDSSVSWTMVSAGEQHSTAINQFGGLYAWGINSAAGYVGALGISSTINRSTPQQVGSSSWSVVAAAKSFGYTGGIKSNYQLFTWGSGSTELFSGKGFGVNTSFSSPLFIPSVSDKWTMATGGGNVTAAYGMGIRQDGYLYVWGVNDNFELGLGTTIARSSPTQLGSSTWSKVKASQHSMGLKTDSTLWTWGLGRNGRLGFNDTLNRSIPTQVGSETWYDIAAGQSFSLAIKADRRLYAWGLNTNGELGIGLTTPRSSPTIVGLDTWTAITAAQYGINSGGLTE